MSAAAYELRAEVNDLRDSIRAVAENYSASTVGRFRVAARAWRLPASQLQAAAKGDAAEERGVRNLRTSIESYISDYGEPILTIAKVSPGTANSPAAVGEGKIRLADPVSKYIPAFKDLKVAVEKDGKVELVPAERQVTIRDLLTHTSGLGSGGIGCGVKRADVRCCRWRSWRRPCSSALANTCCARAMTGQQCSRPA